MTATALDIRRLAVAMAAANGFRFDQLEPDAAASLERSASGALVRLGIDARTKGKSVLADMLDAIEGTMRELAARLDATSADDKTEALIQRTYQAATHAETISRILRALPEPAAAPPPPPAAPLECEEAV